MSNKPSEKEDDYVARQEYVRLKKLEEAKHLALEAEEIKRLKALHQMRCPRCGMELIAVNYRGIEVDKCSECEGVWLDAGELEEVSKMEKSALDKLFGVFRK
ncbi:MAG: zf-TFIIB domain-containing protein [Nitrospira sp.]|nr:zf-TFIIB domain-containing protein [bacterium]MBL7049504.1 zf-TFIIB domain-containing protein [Nitrospira sp.]